MNLPNKYHGLTLNTKERRNDGKRALNLVLYHKLEQTSFCQTSYQELMSIYSENCRKDYLNKSLINIQKTHHISSSKHSEG